MTTSPTLAEEVVQEALLSLCATAGHAARRKSLPACLVATAHHVAVDAVRRESSPVQLSSVDGQPPAGVGRDLPAKGAVVGKLRAEEGRSPLESAPEPEATR